jgi:ABC-type transport system involved in multi-copper enzyme maturation permease subunit
MTCVSLSAILWLTVVSFIFVLFAIVCFCGAANSSSSNASAKAFLAVYGLLCACVGFAGCFGVFHKNTKALFVFMLVIADQMIVGVVGWIVSLVAAEKLRTTIDSQSLVDWN